VSAGESEEDGDDSDDSDDSDLYNTEEDELVDEGGTE
jgi:hypothetical protein